VKSEKSPSSRFTEIDSLRFIACTFVIIQHTLIYFTQFSKQGSILQETILILSPGWLGVLIFFAISGFVIPSSLKGPRLRALKVFFKRRFFRLYPPFWIACIIITLLDTRKYPVAELLWRASMLPVEDRNDLGHSSYFWTLQIELVFYFLISFLFLLFGRFTWRFFISLLSILTIPYAVWVCISGGRFAPFYHFSQCLPFSILLMMWGASCRAILNQHTFSKINSKNDYSRAIKLGLATGTLTIIPFNSVYFGALEWKRFQLHEGSVTILGIFIFLFLGILKPIKSLTLARLGRNTYSTYLLHGAVNLALLYFFTRLGITNWPLSILIVITLAFSFMLGEIFYRHVETPSNSLGRYIKQNP